MTTEEAVRGGVTVVAAAGTTEGAVRGAVVDTTTEEEEEEEEAVTARIGEEETRAVVEDTEGRTKLKQHLSFIFLSSRSFVAYGYGYGTSLPHAERAESY